MKIFKLLFIILMITFAHAGFASDTSDKDKVLVYGQKNGVARGYDLLWKAENITGTFAQESTIARKDDVVYVSSITKDGMPGNRDIFALDAYTGEVITQYTIGPSFGDPVIDGTTLYIGTADESWEPDTGWSGGFGVYSFDISDIKNTGFVLNWFNSTVGRVVPNILIDENNIYFSQFEGSNYFALDKLTGNQVWSFAKGNYGAAVELLHGDHIYITNSFSGSDVLYKVNKIDGTLVWSKPIEGKLWDNSITYSPDHDALFMAFYYGPGSGRIASYDMDGNQRWVQNLNCDSLSFTSYHNNSVFFSDLCGWVYSINPDTGSVEWSTQIGKAGAQATDIASPVIANGQVFIGTKGPGYNTVDTRGRGGFYILDEETGEILWSYEEDDLGDIMSLATVTDGIFYNATNAWDVYAFDIGDGSTSNHLIGEYDQNNTYSTETGLTHDKYVKSTCTLVSDESTCTFENLYTGSAIGTHLDMDTDIVESVVLENGEYHIFVEDSSVYLPQILGLNSLNNIIITLDAAATYDNNIPRLTNIVQDEIFILKSSYDDTNNSVEIIVDNATNFDAEIENFSKPFLGAKSTLDNASVVVEKTGITGTSNINSVDMDVSVSTGDVEIEILDWTSNEKRWSEHGSDVGLITSHSINGLEINQKYKFTINGNMEYIISDSSGKYIYDTEIGTDTFNFILEKYSPPSSSQGSSITYVCKDQNAINYNKFGRHKQSKCEYQEDKTMPSTPTELNPFGGELCSEELLIHENMKNGDTNGEYSSYNNGVITEISLLQSHINRILADDYDQAAGPVDKWFRSKTKLGVERIQVKLNQLLEGKIAPLDVDGIVGPYTRTAINMSC
jgi:outer membrane protein assembly factor BamB